MTLKDTLKIFKDNEDILRGQFGCAFNNIDEIEDCCEEQYNFFTRRNIVVFYDRDFFNGSIKTVLNFIADKMTKASNRIYRVYGKPDKLLECMTYKVE